MARKKGAKKKRHIWHSYLDAGLLLGAAVALVFYFLDVLSPSGIVMVASMAGSVVVLTHKYRHHLTTLGTVFSAYVAAAVAVFILAYLFRLGAMPLLNQVVFSLIIITILLYWLNLFHPPAITFALAYLIFFRGAASYIFVLFASLVLFTAIRLLIYVVHEHLDIGSFFREFVREEEKIVIDEEKRLRRKNVRKSRKA